MIIMIFAQFKIIRGNVQEKHSMFKDIVQIGGSGVNPILKIWKYMIFWQKLEREGVTKQIVKLYCQAKPSPSSRSAG